MTTKFNWRHAFWNSDMPATLSQRDRVISAIYDWHSEWNVDSEDSWIQRVENSNGDTIWDYEFNDCDEIDRCFSTRFLEYMDKKFKMKGKYNVVIGNATKLPLPVDSPSPSAKGAISSSSL